jgi:uncharacterized protein (TIGR02466 family)
MIKITPIFINFIATETLKIDNAKIENFCQDLRRSSRGRVISNGRGWHSDYLDLKTPELQELLEEVSKRLEEVHHYFKFSDSMCPAITEAWANINNKGNFNYGHNHPGRLFSCVYYVKGGSDKGDIELLTPIREHAYTIFDNMVAQFNAFTGRALVHPPSTGELVIFPAWLFHHVRENETDEDRISIALNSSLLMKSK